MEETRTNYTLLNKVIKQTIDDAITAEREACAVIAEEWAAYYPISVFPEDGTSIDCRSAWAMRRASERIAAAIRARKGAE